MNTAKFRELTFQFIRVHNIQLKWHFNCSHKWIAKFKARNRLSTRHGHLKRRPRASPEDIENYRQTVSHIFQIANPDHIINVDESPWHSDEGSLTTWAITGSEDIVLHGDQKTCFTFIGSMNAENRLLPPVFLSSGTTIRSEKNWFEQAHPIKQWNKNMDWNYLTDHTPSGWTTRNSWVNYLDFLRKYIPNNPEKTPEENKIYVICDSYKAHFPSPNNPSDPISLALARNNIELIKVPEGTTEQCQPLDCRVFGALKSHARRILNQREIKNLLDHCDGIRILETYQSLPVSKPEAKKLLVSCYYDLSPHLLEEAWTRAIQLE